VYSWSRDSWWDRKGRSVTKHALSRTAHFLKNPRHRQFFFKKHRGRGKKRQSQTLKNNLPNKQSSLWRKDQHTVWREPAETWLEKDRFFNAMRPLHLGCLSNHWLSGFERVIKRQTPSEIEDYIKIASRRKWRRDPLRNCNFIKSTCPALSDYNQVSTSAQAVLTPSKPYICGRHI